jgi:hypothetical protein
MQDLARKIPDRVRQQLLLCDADPIVNVVDSPGDMHMQTLFAIYYEFLYPFADNRDIHCWRCRGKVLNCFRQIHGDLIAIEKEYQLLKSMQR